jgi:HK97 family phage prohead protease
MTMTALKQLVTTVSALPGRKADEAGLMISTPALDRENDRLMPEGADLSHFQRNSPLLWAHDYRSIPIGTVTSLDVSRAGIKAVWRWLAGDDFAARVRNGWEQGVIRAASVGFLPKASSPNEYGGSDITAWELLEVSLTPVPANPEAVRQLKALGLSSSVLRIREDDWTPASIASAAARKVERGLEQVFAGGSGSRSVLVIEDDDPVLSVTGYWPSLRGGETFLVDPAEVDRVSRRVIRDGFTDMAAHLQRTIEEEICYHMGRIV